MTPITGAVEGDLDEAVLRQLLAQVRPDLELAMLLGKKGRNFLEQRLPELNRAAAHVPAVVLADLDRDLCAPDLIARWLPHGRHANLLLRVAETEIESWLLADRDAAAAFLGVPVTRLPEAPDTLPDPKQLVVSRARRSGSRRIREDMVPAAGSTSHVGPNYVGQLITFATTEWQPERARPRSPSLDRAIRALQNFNPIRPHWRRG